MNFTQKLEAAIQKNNSLLCIGLDPEFEKLPQVVKNEQDPLFAFNKAIIDATSDLVCAFKPNIAFYEAQGIEGLTQLKKTIEYIQKKHPDTPIVLDGKFSDIGNTAKAYAKTAFDALNADAVTVNPYLGSDAIEPFLEYKEKGTIILCLTSNPGSSDFQLLKTQEGSVYEHVARKIVEWDKTNGNCMMVVGATHPEDLKKIREMAPDMFFLVPGVGTQGGDLQKTLKNGLRTDKSGLMIHSSRSVLYSSNGQDFADAARKMAQELKDTINSFRM